MPNKENIGKFFGPLGITGFYTILGCLVGVIADRLLEKAAVEQVSTLKTPIIEGFHVDDLIGLMLPLGLMFLFKGKGQSGSRWFFIGWFVGQLATELYEILHGMGGYEARM